MDVFYRIEQRDDGLVDVWLTPGRAQTYLKKGRTLFRIYLRAVRGIRPDDPLWGGNLEEHIRRNYRAWLESAEVITI